MARITTSDLAELLKQVQTQLAELSERVEKLESAGGGKAAVKSAPEAPIAAEPKAAQPAPPARPELTEEEMIAISAALAAFLGVRVRIRQIRLISTRAWAQQGRVSIQASHILH
jgi:methylmalonyl-CoA carboxyltransferase 12S subunit